MQSAFGATQCVFAEQFPYEISNVPLKDTPCPLEEYSVHLNFHMPNLPFKGAVSLLEKPISLHDMQYFWHRASLSKVQYALKCEILSECFLAPYNRALSFMVTQSSFEKAAFVETWITFHWYMYLIYSNLIQFNPNQSNPDISHLYNPIQSNQPKQIQSSPIQSIQSNPINPIQSI